ncbi:MAG: inositol monophosphatase family protein [Actinomycetota bacterium]
MTSFSALELATSIDPGSPASVRAGHLERVAAEVARSAAALVRRQGGQAVTAATKSTPTDVVTHTDQESERFIRAALLERAPGSTIVGEEFDDDHGANNVGWIVDPIDGTVNFLYDLPVVSVSVAATVDGQVVAGAVADIHRDEVYSAAAGAGARLDGRPISSSTTTDLGHALVGTGFAYDADLRAEQSTVLNRLLPAARDIRCMGSAALNLCWVGTGRLDAFYERDLKVYDYAAGALVAHEGGAVVELPARQDAATIATTPGIEGALRQVLAG